MGSAWALRTPRAWTLSALPVKKVSPCGAHLPVLHTSLLHYATKESWTEAQVYIPDVPVPAESLQGEKVVRDSQSEMSVELCAPKAVNTTNKYFPTVLGLVVKPFLDAARELWSQKTERVSIHVTTIQV